MKARKKRGVTKKTEKIEAMIHLIMMIDIDLFLSAFYTFLLRLGVVMNLYQSGQLGFGYSILRAVLMGLFCLYLEVALLKYCFTGREQGRKWKSFSRKKQSAERSNRVTRSQLKEGRLSHTTPRCKTYNLRSRKSRQGQS